MHPPASTVTSPATSRANSATSRVLPIPASPATNTVTGGPAKRIAALPPDVFARGPADQDRAGSPPSHTDILPSRHGTDHVHRAAVSTEAGDCIARPMNGPGGIAEATAPPRTRSPPTPVLAPAVSPVISTRRLVPPAAMSRRRSSGANSVARPDQPTGPSPRSHLDLPSASQSGCPTCSAPHDHAGTGEATIADTIGDAARVRPRQGGRRRLDSRSRWPPAGAVA